MAGDRVAPSNASLRAIWYLEYHIARRTAKRQVPQGGDRFEAKNSGRREEYGLSWRERCPEHCSHCPIVAPGGAFAFAGDPETKASLARFSKHRRYRQGECVVRQGDSRDGFQVLRRGRVRIYLADVDGHEHTVRYALPGELVAGCSTDRRQQECFSAMAETDDVETCHFPGTNLDPLLVEYPAVGSALLRLMDANLSEAYQRLHRLASTTSRQRLAELLVRLVEGEGQLSLCLPRRQLADLLGVTEETAVRSLTALRQLGLLRKEGRRVVVTDLDRLRSYARSDSC